MPNIFTTRSETPCFHKSDELSVQAPAMNPEEDINQRRDYDDWFRSGQVGSGNLYDGGHYVGVDLWSHFLFRSGKIGYLHIIDTNHFELTVVPDDDAHRKWKEDLEAYINLRGEYHHWRRGLDQDNVPKLLDKILKTAIFESAKDFRETHGDSLVPRSIEQDLYFGADTGLGHVDEFEAVFPTDVIGEGCGERTLIGCEFLPFFESGGPFYDLFRGS